MAAEEGVEYVKSMTSKEIKKLARPEFAANPDKFYPTGTLKRLGFSRNQCPECKNHYWRHCDAKTTCGDSVCEKKYTFIGKGLGKHEKKYTYADAWEGFKRSLTNAAVPCTPIPRYPVVARWRADVDFVAAGIFCFQPYCVTGELEPPANPLICPQFCLRFNDLDNIGITGRHYSGFIMLGIQVFNKPGQKKFWSDECVEFNYNWLTQELKIEPDEITFIEDVWAGGGNLGPSIEYFVGGLELGNMVFMQYKTFPDGSREPLQVQVIDVGIGLERVPWLVNGTATSYMDVFPTPLKYMLDTIGGDINADIWDKYGPLSCLLNVDEVEDLDATWKWISDKIGMEVDAVKAAIEPIKDVYVVLDHTRSVLMAIEDGSLPSNVGGASNVRNILRRVFALLKKTGWWEKLQMEGLIKLFQMHKEDLSKIYGPFKEYKSFEPIIRLEYERWLTTDGVQKDKLKKLLKKRKGNLRLDDWIVAVTSWGVPVDTVAEVTGTDTPGNLWLEIADRQERTVRAEAAVLYSTAHLKETNSIYYHDHLQYEFDAKIIEVMPNVTRNNEPSIVIVDQSSFYPTSGGQEHDTGVFHINGTTHKVVDVMKVGPVVLHVVEPPLPVKESLAEYIGTDVKGQVDEDRRNQLRNNHTATHIVYAACRKVLGPHVWQNGAKKSVHQAHLDITHYKSLTSEQVMAISNEANRIVHRCKDISKGFMDKSVAEKKHGFNLYQGGVVPGNTLRVVSIADTDTEACCGTHADNTAEVGSISILKTNRISDGIVRLYFVAGESALARQNEDMNILNSLVENWGVTKAEIPSTADRFFDGYKRLSSTVDKQIVKILDLQMRCHTMGGDNDSSPLALIRTDLDNPTAFISNLPYFAEKLKAGKKGVVAVGDSFVYGLLGDASLFDAKALQAQLAEFQAAAEAKAGEGVKVKPAKMRVGDKCTVKANKSKKIKKSVVKGVCEFSCYTVPKGHQNELCDFFTKAGFQELE